MELTQEFFNHLILLLGLMYGFTTLKIALCKPFEKRGEKFSWRKLFIGTIKQLIVISGTLVVYVVGTKFGPELLLIQIGDCKVTLQAAVDVTILSVVAVYGAKYIKYLAAFMGIGDYLNDDNVKPVEPEDIANIVNGGNSCNCCCNHNHGKLIGYLYSADECCCYNDTSDDPEGDSIDGSCGTDEEDKG